MYKTFQGKMRVTWRICHRCAGDQYKGEGMKYWHCLLCARDFNKDYSEIEHYPEKIIEALEEKE